MRYKTVLLFGAPGSGKGTQGKILGTIPGFYHSACGDVFRTLDLQSEIVHGGADQDHVLVVQRGDATRTVTMRPEYDPVVGLPRAGVGPTGTWTPKAGKTPAFSVGPLERVLVEGRLVTGGMEAGNAVNDAVDLGLPSVRIEFVDRPTEPAAIETVEFAG